MYLDDKIRIVKAIARFPTTFGLRAFPGDRFRISEQRSYVRDNGDHGLLLYTQREQPDGTWVDFAKGTVAELQREVVP